MLGASWVQRRTPAAQLRLPVQEQRTAPGQVAGIHGFQRRFPENSRKHDSIPPIILEGFRIRFRRIWPKTRGASRMLSSAPRPSAVGPLERKTMPPDGRSEDGGFWAFGDENEDQAMQVMSLYACLCIYNYKKYVYIYIYTYIYIYIYKHTYIYI